MEENFENMVKDLKFILCPDFDPSNTSFAFVRKVLEQEKMIIDEYYQTKRQFDDICRKCRQSSRYKQC